MPLYKTQAVVLRGIKLSEKDKLVTFLTRRYGKIKCVAKGARLLKSRYGASLEPLSHISMVYFGKQNQELFSLNQCDIIHSFQSIREDHQKFYSAIYFLELADTLMAEAQPEPEIFDLLLAILEKTRSQTNMETLCRLFEIRIMVLAGYAPRLNRCIVCQGIPKSYWVGFSYSRHGIICEPCQGPDFAEIKIKIGSLNYLKKLLTLDINHTERLKIPKDSELEIESVTHRLILSRVGRELKSYPFIKQMAAI